MAHILSAVYENKRKWIIKDGEIVDLGLLIGLTIDPNKVGSPQRYVSYSTYKTIRNKEKVIGYTVTYKRRYGNQRYPGNFITNLGFSKLASQNRTGKNFGNIYIRTLYRKYNFNLWVSSTNYTVLQTNGGCSLINDNFNWKTGENNPTSTLQSIYDNLNGPGLGSIKPNNLYGFISGRADTSLPEITFNFTIEIANMYID